ncbi:kinase-like protein [Hypoxylon sp. EC38]|nr:kinase-like protein [Hypoxylon sp. EC38]
MSSANSPISPLRSDLDTYDDKNSDTESDTSTLEWDHEPFSTFQSRVHEFAHKNIWPETDPQHIIVERLRGGGFNRIIGLTRLNSDKDNSPETRYILRIPRLDSTQVENDVAALRFLERHTGIRVPKVITYDDTAHNGLESPFSVLTWIDGSDLCSSFPNFDHPTKKKVAHELGNIFRQMLATQSRTSGTLTILKGHGTTDTATYVRPFGCEDSRLSVLYSNSPNTEILLEQLKNNFQAQKAASLESILRPQFMDRFCTMAIELSQGGWFDDVPNCLTHFDFAPRNILVNPTTDSRNPVITAVLDWDDAGFAPMFMACAPPLWIWGWLHDEDEDERTASEEPATPEARELKRLFEEAAGEDYIRFSYQPAYRLARRLVRFAIDGRIRSNEDMKEADEMLQEWETIK